MKKKRKNLIIIFIFILIILTITIIFFLKKAAKISKIGNTNTSQEIVNDIYDIKSYEITAQIDIESNKNKNKYIIKQKYISTDFSSQEVIEPENIKRNKNNKRQKWIKNRKLKIRSFKNLWRLSNNSREYVRFK